MSNHLAPTARLERHVHANLGAQGIRWLADLPTTAANLASRWGVQWPVVNPASNRSLVVDGHLENGMAVVLKIEPKPCAGAVAALDAWWGLAPAVLAYDADHHAYLVERVAGQPMDGSDIDTFLQVVDAASFTASPSSLRSGRAFVEDLMTTTRDRLGDRAHLLEPFEDIADELAGGSWLCHGDLVPGNVIVDRRGHAKVIDPEPCSARPELDVAKLAVRMEPDTATLLDRAAQAVPHLDRALMGRLACWQALTYVAYRQAKGSPCRPEHLALAHRPTV